MEPRYRGDPITLEDSLFVAPDVEEVLPELEGMNPDPEPLVADAEQAKNSLDATWSVMDTEPEMEMT